jgi:hypothetical protein
LVQNHPGWAEEGYPAVCLKKFELETDSGQGNYGFLTPEKNRNRLSVAVIAISRCFESLKK